MCYVMPPRTLPALLFNFHYVPHHCRVCRRRCWTNLPSHGMSAAGAAAAAAADEEDEEDEEEGGREEGRGRRRICPSNRHSAVERRVASSPPSPSPPPSHSKSLVTLSPFRPSVRPSLAGAAANPGFQFSSSADEDGATGASRWFPGSPQRAWG